MAWPKAGVHSWEDVLAQRYESMLDLSFVVFFLFADADYQTTKDDKPSSLPRYRRRKGTVRGSAPRGMTISQSPIQQPKCMLLNTLPAELRLMIWEMVLGGLRLHIIQRSKKRLGYVICSQRDSCGICRGGLPQPVKNPETCSNMNLMALPVTCKQM